MGSSNKFLYNRHVVYGGFAFPCSHARRVTCLIPIFFANSSCVNLWRLRYALIFAVQSQSLSIFMVNMADLLLLSASGNTFLSLCEVAQSGRYRAQSYW